MHRFISRMAALMYGTVYIDESLWLMTSFPKENALLVELKFFSCESKAKTPCRMVVPLINKIHRSTIYLAFDPIFIFQLNVIVGY